MQESKKAYKLKAKEAEKECKRLSKENKKFLMANIQQGYKFTEEALRKINEMKIPLAKAYEECASYNLKAGRIRKAEKYYLLATRTYGDLFPSRSTNPKDKEKFKDSCWENKRKLEELEKLRKSKGLRGLLKRFLF